jgi:sugar/nucleoside kinase (ribokinase family)
MTGAGALDVLGIGSLAVDDLITIEAFPREDAKVRVLSRERRAGGLVGTALITAARLQARCGCGGALGEDGDSRWLRAALSREGIDLAALASDAAARPFHGTVIIVPASGTRTILSEPGDSGTVALAGLPPARVLLVDHHTPQRALAALEQAQRQGAAIVADCERLTPQAARIEAIADHLIVPLAYARQRGGGGQPQQALQALWRPGRRLVAATDGVRGTWYRTRTAAGWQPAFTVQARDTTGCGDVFHGAYAAGLARGIGPEACLRQASAAAACKAASGSAPRLLELERFLALADDQSRVITSQRGP